MSTKRWLLGYTKREVYGARTPIYLFDFSWKQEWYWSGGWIGNYNMHFHFDNAFLKVPDTRGHCLGDFVAPWQNKANAVVLEDGSSIWEPIETFLDDVPLHISQQWWRIKDLFQQFYALQKAAEVFQQGGHCTDKGRTTDEFNPEMAKRINDHIENVIIREIRLIFDV